MAWTEQRHLMTLVALCVVSLRCSTPGPRWFTEPITEPKPFELVIAIERTQLHHNEKVEATLTLRNVTGRTLLGCLDYPHGYTFLGTDGTNGGMIHVVADGGCSSLEEFVLPPDRDLIWRETLVVPSRVSPGAAEVWYKQAISNADYTHRGRDSFYTEVKSGKVQVTILPEEMSQ